MNTSDRKTNYGKTAMAAELPSISSATSISDNVGLRDYYDKLLFKNNNGKSLTDLTQRATQGTAVVNNGVYVANNGNNGTVTGSESTEGKEELSASTGHSSRVGGDGQKMDFINGFNGTNGMRNGFRLPFSSFQMTPSNSEPTPPSASLSMTQPQSMLQQQQHQPIFNFDEEATMGYQQNSASISTPAFSFDFGPNNRHPVNYYSGSLRSEQNPIESSMKNLSLEDPNSQQYPSARRSSYISDTLIHGQVGSAPNTYANSIFNMPGDNVAPKTMNYLPVSGTTQMGHPQPPPTAPPITYGNAVPNYNQQRRHTQPVNSLSAPSTANANYGHAQIGQGVSRNRYLNYSKQQQQRQQVSDSSNGEMLLENGLVLLASQKLVSSRDLQALYKDCGTKYFSSKLVFEFTDHIKSLLGSKVSTINDSRKQPSVPRFLAFLKSCNLNYNPQSDAFVSDPQVSPKNHTTNVTASSGNNNISNIPAHGNVRERRSNSTSSYLHYKPLVLVALKNGKLELLSTPQNTNISMQRGDLIIIDGDRGKDLALVVEPVVSLDLALFVNFLKKKIHFDSLITSKSQHHPNHTFIQALIESTKRQSDKLNSKLYDVIELTQLIVPSKQVLRFATTWEVATNLHNKFQDELKALHIAQLKLQSLNSGFTHHHNANSVTYNAPASKSDGNPAPPGLSIRPQLNIKILNAEFQFDRKKLTFYYVCEERNDFRELIKELFKFYKTRIWLCAIPNNLGIDSKYYDSQRKELQMYQEMMQHYAAEDLTDANAQQGGGFIVAPPLSKIELDNFQIGVYKELVLELFG